MADCLYAVAWKGQRSGHYYVTVFDNLNAGMLAYYHLLAEGSLPDYSPGAYQHEPIDTIELRFSSTGPSSLYHNGREVWLHYLPAVASVPVGAD